MLTNTNLPARFFTLLASTLLHFQLAAQFPPVTVPFNPDVNNDQLISSPDLLSILPQYGFAFEPGEVLVDSIPLEDYLSLYSSTVGVPAGTSEGQILVWDGTAWTLLNQGEEGQILKVVNNEVSWANSPAQVVDQMEAFMSYFTLGCTDPAFFNFDVAADVNDGSCSNAACDDLSPVSYQGYDYNLVSIGQQCWFLDNLRSESYANGDLIPNNLQAAKTAPQGEKGAQEVYDDTITNLTEYGRLFNAYAVRDERGLCPSGWHVCTDQEFKALEMQLGMSAGSADSTGARGAAENIGGKLREVGTDHWSVPNEGASNSSGFTALGSGSWDGFTPNNGTFYGLTETAYFWTSTGDDISTYYHSISNSSPAPVSRYFSFLLYDGHSVRCMQD